MEILITGGAGFIGTHLARDLVSKGHDVTILDAFIEQIHGPHGDLSDDLQDKVRLIRGSVTDRHIFYSALRDKEVVVHLAAETGTGQSMYNISGYTEVNIQGTAHLCDFIVNEAHGIHRVIVASSRAIYGEGRYFSPTAGVVYPDSRTASSIKTGFEVICPVTGTHNLEVQPTDEGARIHPSSYYGITKQVQEQMVVLACRLKNINGFALRYQNVYGPGQSLKNPYTGILSIFSRLALSGRPINVFEDGLESRDFVYIDDVVRATTSCLESRVQGCHILNVGSGVPTTVREVAEEIKRYVGSNSDIVISGAFREGDIRHNFADLSVVERVIGFKPEWSFKEGLHQFLDWVLKQNDVPVTTGDYEQSLRELAERGLLSGSKP